MSFRAALPLLDVVLSTSVIASAGNKRDQQLRHISPHDIGNSVLHQLTFDHKGVQTELHRSDQNSSLDLAARRTSLTQASLMRKERGQLDTLVSPRYAEKKHMEEDVAVKAQYPYYHTTAEIRSEMQRLAGACNGALTFKTLQDASDSSVSIDVVSIRAKGKTPTNRVFMLFGEHSRELISPESGVYFVQALCGEAKLGVQNGLPSDLLQASEFQFVLNANPRSRIKVEAGDFCIRENPNEVDLNRNWDAMWQPEAASYGDARPGPRPFSEPETRIVRDLVTKFQPTVFVTVHSGTRGMYMPWAYDTQHEGTDHREAMMNILRALDKEHCKCPFGAAGKEVGYPCPGTCLDWVYAELKSQFVFAFEIYVGNDEDMDLEQRWKDIMQQGDGLLQRGKAHLGHLPYRLHFDKHPSDFVQINRTRHQNLQSRDECFAIFNPNTQEKYDETVRNWATVYWKMSELTAHGLNTS